MTTRKAVAESRRWVIKIGSALITNDGQGLNGPAIQSWVQQIANLRAAGKEIILVSSGAVAEGMARIGWKKRPHALHQLQAAAALGQMGLVQHFQVMAQRGLRGPENLAQLRHAVRLRSQRPQYLRTQLVPGGLGGVYEILQGVAGWTAVSNGGLGHSQYGQRAAKGAELNRRTKQYQNILI